MSKFIKYERADEVVFIKKVTLGKVDEVVFIKKVTYYFIKK